MMCSLGGRLVFCLAVTVLGGTAALTVASADPATLAAAAPSDVSIPSSRRIGFASKVNGHRYAISVALPFAPAPRKGYGVLYVLDGDAYFASATEIVRPWNAPDVIVVGIGYPSDPGYARHVIAERGPVPPILRSLPPTVIAQGLERTYDLTLPASDADLLRQQSSGSSALKHQNVGGLDNFLKIIETEIKPRVAALSRVDSTRNALFGHSLGGLAVLHALFVEPQAFRTFIIASPSIWWNDKAVLAEGTKFSAVVESGRVSPRVLVTVGGEESTPPAIVPPSWGISRADLAAELNKAQMVANGRELVAWLKALHGGPDYLVADYLVFDQLNHTSSPFPALVRGVAFAFPHTQ